MPGIFYLAPAVACLSAYNVLYAMGIKQIAPAPVVIVVAFTAMVTALLAGGVQGQLALARLATVSPLVLVLGALAGLAWFGSVYLMGTSLKLGVPLSIAVPIISVGTTALLAMYDWLVHGAPVTPTKTIGWAAAAVAIICLTRPTEG